MTEKTAEPMPDAGPGLAPTERRLLAAMPLHAITSVHGEAGLRERLLTETARSSSPADQGRATNALALASRQREPYASHLLRVTIRILSHYRVGGHRRPRDPGSRPTASRRARLPDSERARRGVQSARDLQGLPLS